MVTVNTILSNFSSGEVSPRFFLQPDAPFVQRGVGLLRNFICTPHGTVFRRGGFVYNQTIPGDYGRIFEFTVSQSSSFIVSVSDDGNLRVNDSAGQVLDQASQFVTNGDFSDDGDNWTVVAPGPSSVAFGTGVCVLDTQSGQEAAIQQEVTVTDGLLEHAIRVTAPSIGERLILNIGTAVGLSDIATFDVSGLRVIQKLFTPGVNTFWIEVRAPDDTPNPVLDKVEVFDPASAAVVGFAHAWSVSDIRQLQVGMPAGDFALYMVSPTTEPHKLSFDPSTRIWTFAPVAFVDKPVVWAAENWPSTIAFFQGRMWLGGTPDEPETFWGSKSALYEDFTPDGTAADDSVEFELSARGKIEWMVGVKNLLIGTENAEHIITSESGIVQAGDIQAERQSSYGSSNNQAEQIGNKVLYTSPDGRKIREMGFQWTDEGYISRDLTFTAEHITKGRRISETIWVQNPNNLLWCVGLNGDLVCATYERGYEILGWHHHTTEGDFLSIASIESFGQSQLWALTRRSGELFLERYDDDDYMDANITINNDTPSTAVSAPHLANRTVAILTDGATHPDITLDGSGDGTLQLAATNVLIGLNFVSTLVTIPFDFSTKQGSARLMMKRWPKIYVSVLEGYPPLINGKRNPERHPQTPMNTGEPPRTEYYETTGLGYDRDALVTVEQDLPVSCEINAIFGEVTGDTT